MEILDRTHDHSVWRQPCWPFGHRRGSGSAYLGPLGTLVRVLDHEGRILFKGLKEFTKWVKIVSLSKPLFYNRFRWRSSSKTLKRDFQSCLSYQLFRFTRFETRYQTRTVRAATDVAIAPISSPGSVPQDVLEILRSQLTGKKIGLDINWKQILRRFGDLSWRLGQTVAKFTNFLPDYIVV